MAAATCTMTQALWMRHRALAGATALLIQVGAVTASGLPGADVTYPYVSANQDVGAAIRYFGKNMGIGVSIDPAVTGKIAAQSRGELTRQAYIDQLAAECGLVWFFDGTTLHVAPASNVETEVFFLKHNDGAAILRALKQLGVYQHKFSHRFARRNRVLLVSGPSAYVRMVKKTIEAAEKADRTETTVMRGAPTAVPSIAPSVIPARPSAPP